MLCGLSPTPKDMGTGPTASQSTLPPCEPLKVHVPAVRKLTVDPAIEHTAGVVEVTVTAKPDVADAVTVPVLPTAAPAGGAEKMIVCVPFVTVMD